jgi:dihydroorotate dehydrogenase (NAD+) catalytic subunit
VEFLAAGASAVQVGTVIFNDPSAPARVAEQIGLALDELGLGAVADVVGAAHRPRSGREGA